jgi:hypothetical protein
MTSAANASELSSSRSPLCRDVEGVSAAAVGRRGRSRMPASASAADASALCACALRGAALRGDLGPRTGRRTASALRVRARAGTAAPELPDCVCVAGVGLDPPASRWLAPGAGDEASGRGAVCGRGCAADPRADPAVGWGGAIGWGAGSGTAGPRPPAASAGIDTTAATSRHTTTSSPIRARIGAADGRALRIQHPPGRSRSTSCASKALLILVLRAAHDTPPPVPDQRLLS